MTKSATAYEGGYYLLKGDLIRTGLHTHTLAVDAPISWTTLDALNRVQSTPWKINGWLLDVLTEAYRSGARIAGLPYADAQPVPKKSPEEWAAMSEEERNLWKFGLSEIHGANARMENRRKSFLMQVSIATEMRDRPAIWFPHFLDFRGRFYPMVQMLHPQSDDTGKSLLQFADGKRLGERGWFWLRVRAANCFGNDKVSLADRVTWVEQNLPAILDSARDPLDGQRFWMEADEPWGFLATCREIAEALEGNPADYVSHLPIPLDGSCNGLQHLSAMGRDPVGARATNVAANTERQDIYTEVANVVARMVSEDAVNGDELAHEWVGKVNRKVVKRAVMTTPYGVTERGIAEQLMLDGHTNGMDRKAQAATYLKTKIIAALDETVVSAKAIMAWLQKVAATLAEHNVAFRFTTPTLNVIQQSYYHLNRQVVQTLAGRLVLWEEDKTGGLQARKQMLAAAPNLIHAFDASHLALTVNELAARVNSPVSFAMIHDSFGTHACDTDTLSAVLRDEFASMYQINWLEKIEEEVRSYAPHVDLPSYTEFVTLGDFDVSECRNSEFFFA